MIHDGMTEIIIIECLLSAEYLCSLYTILTVTLSLNTLSLFYRQDINFQVNTDKWQSQDLNLCALGSQTCALSTAMCTALRPAFFSVLGFVSTLRVSEQ